MSKLPNKINIMGRWGKVMEEASPLEDHYSLIIQAMTLELTAVEHKLNLLIEYIEEMEKERKHDKNT